MSRTRRRFVCLKPAAAEEQLHAWGTGEVKPGRGGRSPGGLWPPTAVPVETGGGRNSPRTRRG
jgi:hypothetical protein